MSTYCQCWHLWLSNRPEWKSAYFCGSYSAAIRSHPSLPPMLKLNGIWWGRSQRVGSNVQEEYSPPGGLPEAKSRREPQLAEHAHPQAFLMSLCMLYTDGILSKNKIYSMPLRTFVPGFNLVRQEVWEDVLRSSLFHPFLANEINVLTLNENNDFLIDFPGTC